MSIEKAYNIWSMQKTNSLELLELKKWFDEGIENEVPRLISFVFKK